MPVERFFTKENIAVNLSVALTGVELHHLAHVTRISEGETIELVNGKGVLATALVQQIGKKRADLLIQEVKQSSPPSRQVILVQAIPRINRLDFILEKGTELGMTHLWLFPGKRSERKQLTESQIEHMHAVTIAAMKQCGRLYLPEITIKKPLLEWAKIEEPALFGDLNPDTSSFKEVWEALSSPSKVLFFIGPESGFADDEEAFLRQMGVKGVKLHDNILRTDTAAIVALSLITAM